jgi:hypothetical protein
MKGRHLLVAAALAITLGGCKTLGSLTQSDAEKSLQATLRAYEATVRWGYPGQAYSFLKPEMQTDLEIPKELDNIQVTGYQVIKPPNRTGEKHASQTAVIKYLYKDRQVERTIIDNQSWEYDKEQDSWARINLIPGYQ